jgi:hypothetical protein
VSAGQAAGLERLSPGHSPAAPAAALLAGEGGYLVPQGFWHNLQIALKAYGGTFPLMRQVVPLREPDAVADHRPDWDRGLAAV